MTRIALPALAALLLAACGNADAEDPAPGDETEAAEAEIVTLADYAGDWSGTLKVMGQALPLVLRVEPGAPVPVTLDSPAQGAFGLEADASVEDATLTAAWSGIGATYTADLSKDRRAISGKFVQGGQSIRLRMTRADAPIERPDRPQAVVGTPPYEVVTGSAESVPGVRLAYTLTLPEASGPVPGVVLVTGSGPQDRDETVMGHKPFAVLADHLTRAGIAVLRFDDRGVARSTGAFEGATSDDFADDAAAMLAELRRVAAARGVELSRAGLIGHSEGGLVAALAASETNAEPDFIVTLAAPYVPMGDILIQQTGDALRLGGAPPAQVEASVAVQRRLVEAALTDGPPEAACDALADAARGLPQSVQAEAQAFCAPWFHRLLRIDPAALYGAVDAPILAMFGALDSQVALGPNEEAAFAVQGAEVVVWPGLNHLFQTAETGAVAEYAVIEETMSPAAMDGIVAWIDALGAE